MKNELIRKGLVFGMVLLFVGTSVVSATIYTNQSKAKDNNNTVKIAEDTIYNLIGGVNVTFDFPLVKGAVKWEWWKVNDRNFTYPITNGTVDVNYTIKLQAYSIGVFIIPRLVGLISTLFYPNEISRGSNWKFCFIKFTDVFPGKVFNIYVHCKNRMPTPPPDQNSTKTRMWAFNQLSIFVFPPVYGPDDSLRHSIFFDANGTDFWANFTSV